MVITLQYLITFLVAVILMVITLILDLKKFRQSSSAHGIKLVRNMFALLLLACIIWLCVQNFGATLTLLVIFTGVIGLIEWIFYHRTRKKEGDKPGLVIEYACSFFFVLLLVWVIRSYIVQPYRVPTGSLEPTVLPGDFIAVNQFAYGLRFPIFNLKFFNVDEPKTGQIALVYYPLNPDVIFVKRVIGTPGDHIVYKDKVLYINGKEMKQTDVGPSVDVEPAIDGNPEERIIVEVKEEDLNGVKHKILINPNRNPTGDMSTTVPSDMYFMMGDNRDNSDDSRSWGFVPEQNLIGKAFLIWMSWDPIKHRVRWNRIGTVL